MNKEEILEEETDSFKIMTRLKSDTLEAMDIYSKQIAIAFKEWQDENLEEKKWENYDGHDTWYNPVIHNVISTT